MGFVFNDRRYAGGYQKKESLAIKMIIVIVERTGLRVSPVFLCVVAFLFLVNFVSRLLTIDPLLPARLKIKFPQK